MQGHSIRNELRVTQRASVSRFGEADQHARTLEENIASVQRVPPYIFHPTLADALFPRQPPRSILERHLRAQLEYSGFVAHAGPLVVKHIDVIRRESQVVIWIPVECYAEIVFFATVDGAVV